LGEDDLLLIAARQSRDCVGRFTDLHSEVANPLADQRVPLAEGDKRLWIQQAIKDCDRGIVFDRLGLNEAKRQAIFRDIADPGADRLAVALEMNRTAVEPNEAASRLGHAEQA